jgi:hypothetical protein
VSVELLKLRTDRRTTKDLEPLRSHNPSIVCCTKWHHIPEDGKVGYIFLFFSGFLAYYNMYTVPDFVTITTINSVALESWRGITYMRVEVRKWVYIAQNLYSLFTTPIRTVQIQLHPLLSHMLSSKTEAFIVPWNKFFCSLLTDVHTSLLSLKVWPLWFCLSSANRR